MKQLKLLTATVAVAGLCLFLFSCNSQSEKKVDDASLKNDTTAGKPQNILFIKHRVTNYEKWLADYVSHDSIRRAYGLHNYGVSRGIDDPNMVLVSLKIEDMSKAKTFISSPDLKADMQKGGVEGEPAVMYYDRQRFDISTTHDSMRLMISHKVKDWEAWKKEFENDKQARIDAGLKDRSYGYDDGDNKMVYVIVTYSDLKKAKDYFASKELQDKMQAAGVEGAPTMFFYKLVQKY